MKDSSKRKTEEDEVNKLNGSATTDCSQSLIKIVSSMVIFIAGAVIGLSASMHISHNLSISSDLLFPTSHYTAIAQDEKCLDIEKFVNPDEVWHDMNDEELFWRASMLPQKGGYPYKRVPKVAFLFLIRGPLPFMPLWERFFQGHEGMYTVYVHTLPGYRLSVDKSSMFFDRQIPSQKVKWGSIELADAERRLLANALLDFSNERFVLLSESCIPVYDFLTVYRYLTQSNQSFIESYDDPSRYGRGRYSRHMLPDIKLAHWRKGSQWFELSRILAVHIVADIKYYDIFRRHCKPSCYPDEHYLPTYVNMFFGPLNSNRSVTWVDWSISGPHPATFQDSDISEAFIEAIRDGNGTTCEYNAQQTNICYLFARKFAPSALEPLLNLTSKLMKI